MRDMQTIDIIFTRHRTLVSLILRSFLWSPWSHCALIDGDNVVDAIVPIGVREVPLADLLRASSHHEIRQFPCKDRDAVLRAARSQIGKPYDWLGILGIVLSQRWETTNRWFCSELIAWSFEQADSPLFRARPFRVTPRDLSMLPH